MYNYNFNRLNKNFSLYIYVVEEKGNRIWFQIFFFWEWDEGINFC